MRGATIGMIRAMDELLTAIAAEEKRGVSGAEEAALRTLTADCGRSVESMHKIVEWFRHTRLAVMKGS